MLKMTEIDVDRLKELNISITITDRSIFVQDYSPQAKGTGCSAIILFRAEFPKEE